jgi:hypothetical protein
VSVVHKFIKSYVNKRIIVLSWKELQIYLLGPLFVIVPCQFLPECRMLKSEGFITPLIVSFCDVPSGVEAFKVQ